MEKPIKVRIKIGDAPEVELDVQNTTQETHLRAVSTELRSYYKAIKTRYELDSTPQTLAMVAILVALENIELREKIQQQDANALRVLHDIDATLDSYLPK